MAALDKAHDLMSKYPVKKSPRNDLHYRTFATYLSVMLGDDGSDLNSLPRDGFQAKYETAIVAWAIGTRAVHVEHIGSWHFAFPTLEGETLNGDGACIIWVPDRGVLVDMVEQYDPMIARYIFAGQPEINLIRQAIKDGIDPDLMASITAA